MSKLSLWVSTLGFSTLLSFIHPSQAAELVNSEIYQPAPYALSTHQVQLKLSSLDPAQRGLSKLLFPVQSMHLGMPSTAELSTLAQQESQYRALKIGIERIVPALPAAQDWVWQPVLGGQAAQFMLSSAGAVSLRALLQLEQALPAGVELRIFSPEQTNEVYGAYQASDFKALEGSKQFQLWTPTITGSQLGLEVFAPEGIDLAQIQLSVPQISHIDYDFKTSQFKLADEAILKFSSCDVSMACAPTAWQPTAQAVARYIFTNSSGSSFLCTGTLLADKDNGTQIPYFITAAHCINDATLAASMDFYWFHQETSCGSGNASWVRTTGGADLLASRTELDGSLVRLRNLPPIGAMLSGWTLSSLATHAPVVGIHHGSGYPKQFSQGNFVSYAQVSSTTSGFTVTKDPAGSFTQVAWTQGITAQGSSGSGLWTSINGSPYLKGTLVGGSSSCATPHAPDEYTRLERFHPYVATWLEASGGKVSSLVSDQPLSALVDGVIMARYLAGKRGAELTMNVTTALVNYTQLETKLDLLKPTLDLDGDGLLEANKDGILMIRYLAGLKDAALIGQFDFTNSKRKTAAEINQYIETILF